MPCMLKVKKNTVCPSADQIIEMENIFQIYITNIPTKMIEILNIYELKIFYIIKRLHFL